MHCSVSKVTNLMAWACLVSEEEILLFVTLSRWALWLIQSCVQCLHALFLRIKLVRALNSSVERSVASYMP